MTEPSLLQQRNISFKEAFWFWLKLGFISFGGPAGQIAIMHQELVERRKWISEKRFLHALNYCMVLPGPEAQQLATYIGWLMHRTWGGVVAGALFVLPSLFILIALSWVYVVYGDVPIVEAIFYGIKPAVVAIVLHAAYRIGSRALKKQMGLWMISLLSFLAIFVWNVPFPVIVLSAVLIGIVIGKWRPHYFKHSTHASAQLTAHKPAVIDDNTPTPLHAQFLWMRLIKVLAAGALLWLLPMLFLWQWFGWQHTFTQMAWFFTKAALLTFGGAYAVLPYVYQGAVGFYGWVTPTQMIDGLALGETTPGPLIMVVAFVGFLGGYLKAALGADHLLLGGVVAACLVTWFTFLPSFIFILAGGPLVESTHDEIKFTAPLTAITAVVVGVIFNLALFFGYHVLWPSGLDQVFLWPAALITLAAAVALFKFKIGIIKVLAGCALSGVIINMLL